MNIYSKILFCVFSCILAVLLAAFSSVKASAAGPTASATCSTGQLVITLTPPAKHDHWAIRVDDTSNSFQPTKMRPGDVLIDNYKQNVFQMQGQTQELYNWWIHSVTKDGVWSDAAGGTIRCPLRKPVALEGSYSAPYVTLQWKAVEGAVRYGIRVDNTANIWNPESMQDGDHLLNNLTETQFRFKASPGRKIVWWVHAIDKYGVWTEGAQATFITK